jgi:hypothetical protein
VGGAQGWSTWDVHIGYLPPSRWDELADRGSHAMRTLGGHEVRPGLTAEPVAWVSLGMVPRWIGEDSTGAVAAIEPSVYRDRGADEWRRFLAGAQRRGEVALAISMIGHPRDPSVVRFSGLTGPSESVRLPGAAMGFGSVEGFRIALAAPPAPAEDLGRADRDLALRLLNTRDLALDWWSLHLSGAMVAPGGGGPSRVLGPTGSLLPLLVSPAGEVVAAVWSPPDESIRHYVIPWLPEWTPVLDWLGKQAIPEFIPAAVRRIHAGIGEDPELQTTGESSARAALAELEGEYQVRREALVQRLDDARAAADDTRHSLLFASSTALEEAVSRVLSDAGCEVQSLDRLLGETVNADVLVEYQGRRRLVEVKRASGNASERLVETTRKHLDTWPKLRPDIEVEGIVLIVNHQASSHPGDRSAAVYTRAAFVESLSFPVITTLQLFDAWRRGDFGAIREAVFGDTAPFGGSSSGTGRRASSTERRGRRARLWRRRD